MWSCSEAQVLDPWGSLWNLNTLMHSYILKPETCKHQTLYYMKPQIWACVTAVGKTHLFVFINVFTIFCVKSNGMKITIGNTEIRWFLVLNVEPAKNTKLHIQCYAQPTAIRAHCSVLILLFPCQLYYIATAVHFLTCPGPSFIQQLLCIQEQASTYSTAVGNHGKDAERNGDCS